MYAVVIPVKFNDVSAASTELTDLVAQVSEMRGFVAGYWIGFEGDHGTAMIVFESEEGAQALANIARRTPSENVASGSVLFGKVWAHA
jgi:hypothetical protein